MGLPSTPSASPIPVSADLTSRCPVSTMASYGGFYGKRSAEPFYGGVAVHPGRAVSSTQRSAQGLSLGYGYGYGHGFYGYGKRSAEPFYGAAVTVENNNNLHGHELGSGYSISQPHPGHSGSSQHVSRIHSNILLPYSSGFGY